MKKMNFEVKEVEFSREDVIKLKENNIKIALIIAITNIYAVLILTKVFAIWIQRSRYPIFILTISSLVYIFPFLNIVFSRFYLKTFFYKLFILREPELILQKEEIGKIKNMIGIISDCLHLKHNPKILISEMEDIPPLVFGTSGRASYIIFPANYNKIYREVSKKDEEISEYLKTFTLFHELSHIKHRDHLFIGKALFLLISLKYWMFAVSLITMIFSFVYGFPYAASIFDQAILGIVYFTVMYFVTLSVSRYREFLADARASLYFPEENLNSITAEKIPFHGKGKSYLEFLIDYFNSSYKKKTGKRRLETILGFTGKPGCNSLKSVPLQKMHHSHPRNIDRISILKEKFFLKKTVNIVSRGSALWIGLMFALLFSYFRIFTYTIVPSAKFLTQFFVISISVPIIFFFTIPIKDSPTSVKSKHKMAVYCFFLWERLIILYLVFIYSSSFIISIYSEFIIPRGVSGGAYFHLPGHNAFDVIIVIISVPFFGIMLVFLYAVYKFTSDFFAISNPSYTDPDRRYSGKHKIQLLLFFSLLVTTFHFLLNVSFSSIFPGMILPLLILYFWPNKYRAVFDAREGYTIYLKSKGIQKADWRGFDKFLFWRQTRYLILMTIVLTVIIELSAKNLFTPYLSYFIFIDGVILTGCSYPVIKNGDFDINKSIRVFLETIRQYLYSLEILASDKIIEQKDVIFKTIDRFKLHDYSYKFFQDVNFGITTTTFNAIYSLMKLEIDNDSRISAKWVLNCENDEGGFSPIKGLESRLSSTYESLFLLNQFDMIKLSNRETHSVWIKSLQKKEGFFIDSISKFPKLEQTFYALNSLYFLRHWIL